MAFGLRGAAVAGLLLGLAFQSPGVQGATKGGEDPTNIRSGPSSFSGSNNGPIVRVTQFGSGSAVSATTNGFAGVEAYGFVGTLGYGLYGAAGFGYYVGSYNGGYYVGSFNDGFYYGSYSRGYYYGAYNYGTGSGVVGIGYYGSGVIGYSVNGYAGAFYGDVNVTGAVLRPVRMSSTTAGLAAAMESPEVWSEDFGTGRMEAGVGRVKLDPRFLKAVNTKAGYHVFLSANGETRGLYVGAKRPDGFDVREMGRGGSTVTFSYRIVAHRKGYENARLREVKASPTLLARLDAAPSRRVGRLGAAERLQKRLSDRAAARAAGERGPQLRANRRFDGSKFTGARATAIRDRKQQAIEQRLQARRSR